MNPQEEAESLREFPLPPQVAGQIITPEDKILPTRIAAIDMDISEVETEIKSLQDKLKDLQSDRAILIDHAIKHNIFEDMRFRIQTQIRYGQRVLDLEAIRKKSPAAYKNYIQTLKQKFKDEYTEKVAAVKTTVILGIADKVFGETVVKSCSTRPETPIYKVVKRDE